MATLTPELFEALPVIQKHIKKLFTLADGTWDGCRQHEFEDLATLRACVEAVGYMKNGEKFERITLTNGETRAACEVVAYYELEGLVTSGAGNQTEQATRRGANQAHRAPLTRSTCSARPHGGRWPF